MTPREALKGKKVYIYARVSGEKQEGTLPDQLATIKEGLKALGFKGQAKVFSEQASGTKNPLEDEDNRPELLALLKEVHASEKPAVIVVRDIQRFSRDPCDLGEIYNPLRRKDIPVISINESLVLGTKNVPQPQADLVAPIFVAAGGQEVSTRILQTKQGLKRSKEKGILQGSTVNLYRKDALEPRGELLRMLKADVSGRQIALRLSKSTSWVRKNKATLQRILLEGGDELLANYLETINLIRDFMNEMDEDITGSRATKRMKTVVRMTSGYMNDPAGGFSKPTREDIEEYYNNFNQYKVKDKR
jgi:DNA invertase Pin-like site-specific DNA recombinase